MDITKEHASFIRVFFKVFGPSFASEKFVKEVAGFFDRLGKHYAEQISHLQDLEPKTTGRALASLADGIIVHKGLFSISTHRHRKLIEASLKTMFDGMKA